MYDRELIEQVVGAARMTLPFIVESTSPTPVSGLSPIDVDAHRRLVAILVDSGTDAHALAWTAQTVELTAKVMAHHRNAIGAEHRRAWAEISMLLRTAGIAFAEAVGRVPGSAATVEVDALEVTRRACAELAPTLDREAVVAMIAAADVVLGRLDALDGREPFPSPAVERVAVGLRSGPVDPSADD